MKLLPDWLRPAKKQATPLPAPIEAKSFVGAEGSWRGPFFGIGEWGGSYQLDPLGDGWQRNLTAGRNEVRRVSAVYACVMLTARAVSQCTPLCMVEDDKGERAPSRTTPAARVFRAPNAYETWNQIILNTVCELLFGGESLWLAVRDNRYVITQVHRIPHGSWQVMIEPETHEIFYAVSANENDLVQAPDILVPARDVCHFRQHCPRHPLIGESPISAAALAIGLNVSLARSQLAFFSQANRPSGVMTTDTILTSDQMTQLRERFDEQSKMWQAGGVPILGGGLKFQPMSLSQTDSQLIEQQKMSIAEIARVFGVPMAMISDTSGPQGGTEALIGHWLSIGLGSVIETIERSLDRFFGLPIGQSVELDPAPLLRVDFAAQIDGLTKSIQGGLMSINEARRKRGLPPVEYGDVPVLQQQMVPIDLLHDLHVAGLSAAAAPEPEPDEPEEPDAEDPEQEPDPDADPDADPEDETEPDEKMDKGYMEYLLRSFAQQGASQ